MPRATRKGRQFSSPEELWQHAAVHQAGHTIVALAVGLTVHSVEIGRTEVVDRFGPGAVEAGYTHIAAPDDDLTKLDRARDVTLTLLAGSLAEEHILGWHGEDGYVGDSERVRACNGWVNVSDEDAHAVRLQIKQTLPPLVAEARRLV